MIPIKDKYKKNWCQCEKLTSLWIRVRGYINKEMQVLCKTNVHVSVCLILIYLTWKLDVYSDVYLFWGQSISRVAIYKIP